MVIDGFTVEGAHSYSSPPLPAGIYVEAAMYKYAGKVLFNNILHNSSTGRFIYTAVVQDVMIQHNLFRDNNKGGEVDLLTPPKKKNRLNGIFPYNGVPYPVVDINENEFKRK